MKNKTTRLFLIPIIILIVIIVLAVIVSKVEGKNDIKNLLNADRIMSDGSYQIRFSDLVSLEALKEYDNKTVTAIGYLSPITSYDGSFGYLMNLPYQTCPYCLPSDTKITNTIAIFAKNGIKIDFTEAAVMVKGTLKLEPYTDEYGYSYSYRIVDVSIEEADTSELGDKIALYNKLAQKEILTNIMQVLYAVDENVYYDEYTSNGTTYERKIVDITSLKTVLKNLEEFNSEDVSILKEVTNELKDIATKTNKLIEEEKYNEVLKYKSKTLALFYKINDWMELYQL